MTNSTLLFILIAVPILAGITLLMVRNQTIRRSILWALCPVLTISALLLLTRVPFSYTPPTIGAFSWDNLITALELLLLGYAVLIGVRFHDPLIIGASCAQALVLVLFEAWMKPEAIGPAFTADWLSLILILMISVIGPLIAVYGTGYMSVHESHLGLARSRQPRFFAILLGFIGIMNMLALSNRLSWFSLAWEATTLASFLLISHDGTPEANRSGRRALRINLCGGVALTIAIVLIYRAYGSLSLSHIAGKPASGIVPLLAMAFFVIASYIKSAQMPFQSWLLGAMVAPTPVSALLHSSTMVKAGIYLLIRLAPSFQGTRLATVIALSGAFVFASTSALAFSQTNAKKVLAYSTIANLGLIIACAGVGSPLSIGAAMALMLFHGLSKALLFISVGSIEQRIGTRDIEAMAGLIDRMPLTTVTAVVGMLSVLLPPFGVLISKWAVMEAAARMPVNILLIAMGSALTLAFWTKWMARLLASSYKDRLHIEPLARSKSWPMVTLGAIVLVSSLCIGTIMNGLVTPAERAHYGTALEVLADGDVSSRYGTFLIWPSVVGLALMAVLFTVFAIRSRKLPVAGPYLCGENASDGSGAFRSTSDQVVELSVSGVYLENILGEKRLGRLAFWVSILAIILLIGVIF